MGLFSKPEIVILKESSDAKIYLEKLEEILPKAKGDLKDRIQKEIAITTLVPDTRNISHLKSLY